MIERIKQAWPIEVWQHSRVVVAVSGGPDSMLLLECLSRLSISTAQLLVVHCNHRLRGEESDADARFVEDECQRRGIGCRVAAFSDLERSDVSEDALRRLRYRYLKCVALEIGANWIALGHNADDNLETFLHRFLRGTGMRGLRGIPFRRRITTRSEPSIELIRPLLRISRREILRWLDQNRIPFRIDSSNLQTNYTRNRIRAELLPVMDAIGGQSWRDRALATIEQIAEAQLDLICRAEEILRRESNSSSPDLRSFETQFACLRRYDWTTIQAVLIVVWTERNWPLRDMTYKHWRRVRETIARASHDPHPQRLDLPGRVRLEIRKGVFRLTRDEDQ